MLFSSLIFWILVVTTLVLTRFFKRKGQNIILLIASLAFYAHGEWEYFPVLLVSASVDFFAGFFVQKNRPLLTRRLALAASLGINLGILAYFEYATFFLSEVLPLFGFQSHVSAETLTFPLGISFYTFQALSYTIDCYRGKIP